MLLRILPWLLLSLSSLIDAFSRAAATAIVVSASLSQPSNEAEEGDKGDNNDDDDDDDGGGDDDDDDDDGDNGASSAADAAAVADAACKRGTTATAHSRRRQSRWDRRSCTVGINLPTCLTLNNGSRSRNVCTYWGCFNRSKSSDTTGRSRYFHSFNFNNLIVRKSLDALKQKWGYLGKKVA